MSIKMSLRAAVAAVALVTMAPAANAAGALAIGVCAAYGFANDYPNVASAEAAARANCSGDCQQVVSTRKGCVAFAVDGHKPCGPLGYANAPRLGTAQNLALQSCYKYGGKDCMIRAFICDSKG